MHDRQAHLALYQTSRSGRRSRPFESVQKLYVRHIRSVLDGYAYDGSCALFAIRPRLFVQVPMVWSSSAAGLLKTLQVVGALIRRCEHGHAYPKERSDHGSLSVCETWYSCPINIPTRRGDRGSYSYYHRRRPSCRFTGIIHQARTP